MNLVRELAVYEKLEQHARATPDDFRRHLFGPRPAAEAALAEVDGEPVGFALWFTTFSTFRGQPGLYLEDIFVEAELPRARDRQGAAGRAGPAGRRARVRAAGMVGARTGTTPRSAFTAALGARPMDEWTVYRIDDEPLRRLAAIAPSMLELPEP